MRRLIASSMIAGLAISSAAIIPPSSALPADRAAKTQATKFAFKAFGYGTRVKGGQIPVKSDSTAWQTIGCTNKAGLDRQNHEAEVTVPGLGVASGVKTRVWTTQEKGVATAHSRHTIAQITLGNENGTVDINAIRSISRAFHDAKGYHAETDTKIGSIVLTRSGEAPQELALPTPDRPVEIPGLATIAVGQHFKKAHRNGARAWADVIDIQVPAPGSRFRIAHSEARISGGVLGGIFNGYGSGTRAEGLQDNVTHGRTPLLVMPCQGTNGKLRTKSIASTNLGDQVKVGALSTRESADQTRKKSFGFIQANIARIELGDGDLVVDAIKGRANVTRKGKKVMSNSNGTTIGSITANGEAHSFPDTDVLEIPGVARLEQNVVEKLKHGIHVIALRITLLDGSAAVINLGEAKLKIRKSGNKMRKRR
ncbi:choice-of-anchor P family protein [Nocardioides sp.]|uniref:choice-of-anchor P family protein n=1 Tax=Nocardioides sp. TaxID=35761 RepID=UPI00356A3523